jgi:hypothetical protein
LRAKAARAAATTSNGSIADLARPTGRSPTVPSVRPKRTISVAAKARPTHHLALYAKSAARQKRTADERKLLPPEHAARKRGGHLSDVKAVVCLIAHDGVVRPAAWVALLQDPQVSIVIHSDKDLPTALRAYRYPFGAVTAWEDISLFNLMIDMVGYAVKTYPDVRYIYTCPGNGVPIAGGEAMVDPRRLQPNLPLGESLLGIPAVEEKPTMPNWEPARVKAMATQGYLQPIPARCYGSMWVGLSRADADLLMSLAPGHQARLAAAYRAAYAHAGAEHAASHARLAPDEEFIPYLLHVIGGRRWPKAHFHIMAEVQAKERKCNQCEYMAGHGKLLTAAEEVRLRKRSACCLFMRKVQGPGE